MRNHDLHSSTTTNIHIIYSLSCTKHTHTHTHTEVVGAEIPLLPQNSSCNKLIDLLILKNHGNLQIWVKKI